LTPSLRTGLHLLVFLMLSGFLLAQDGNVRGVVSVVHPARSQSGSANVVVWLSALGAREPVQAGPAARLEQKDKGFTPHILPVTVGTTIEFPNHDPFFHDVFSIYHGKPFDLGLYESGAVRKVRFSQPGVSYIFCNIHPQMSAVVITLSTPHFATTAKDGTFRILHIPAGSYRLEVWDEFTSESELASVVRQIEIEPGDNSLDTIIVHATDTAAEHLNKYGEPYPADKHSPY
jgi:plastocyanin